MRSSQPCRAHRPVAIHVVVEGERGRRGAESLLECRRDRAQVGAGAEVPAGAGEDRDARVGVGVEGAEGVGERARGRAVDGVAHLGAVRS